MNQRDPSCDELISTDGFIVTKLQNCLDGSVATAVTNSYYNFNTKHKSTE